jgi:arginase
MEGLAIPIKVKGIPHFTGAFVSGTELSPDALRKAGIVEQLREKGMEVEDLGNLKLPDYLPRHNIPPVRNWPAPRMLWDLLEKEAVEWFGPDDFLLMLGGDCSLIVGTAMAHQRLHGELAYLLVIDGHLDAVTPSASRCIGAAGMGLWFLLQDQGVWVERSGWTADRVKLVGCQKIPGKSYGVEIVTLDQLQVHDLEQAISAVLNDIPVEAKILVHFDVDVMNRDAMPAAYSPSETGLCMEETQRLLTQVLLDPRVVGMEVTEFSALRDTDGEQAQKLVQLIVQALSHR